MPRIFVAELAATVEAGTHKLALIPKGIKAGDLRRGYEGLDIWNTWGNYCVAPKSVGSETTNGDCSRSQHGDLIRLPGPEGLTNSMLKKNYYASRFMFWRIPPAT